MPLARARRPADTHSGPDGPTRLGVLGEGLAVVWTGIRAEPGIFACSVVGSAVYGIGTAGSGWLLGRLTDTVLAPAFTAHRIEAGRLWSAVGLLIGIAVLTSAGVVVRRAAAGITMYRLQARYRRAVTRRYLELPLSWHQAHPTGQLLSNANADVEATWQVFAPLPMSLGVLVMLIVGSVAMVAADPVLAAVGLLVLPGLLGVNAAYQRRMSPLVMHAQGLRAQVSAVAHESFEGALVVKTLGRQDVEVRRFAASARELRDANVAVGRTRGMFDPLIDALPTLGTLAVLALGASRISSGAAAAGDVVQVAYVLTLVAFPIRALGWVLGELPRTVVGWRRVRSVLTASGGLTFGDSTLGTLGDLSGQVSSGRPPAALSVHGVDFSYDLPSGDRSPVLFDVGFEVAAGSTVALVGPTGSGKSTLVGLLARLADPQSGQVRLDGVDLRDLRRGAVAGQLSLVPQTAFVFDDTVRGNVTLGAELDDDAVWRALRVAQADGFVAALADGLDTRVGERGTTLSGGQRQRLALARALVREPRLIILDDATSAVDPRVEAAILAGLRGSLGSGGRATIVVVAYRMATIALADEVVYLEQGRVVARGTHAELLETVPGYRAVVTAYQRDEVAG